MRSIPLTFLLLQLLSLCATSTLAHPTSIPETLSIAQHYIAFGPLPFTSSERGASPLRSISSKSTLDTLLTLSQFPSETAVGGSATWRPCSYNASADGLITAPFPDADPYMPYEAWAIANFSIADDIGRPHILQCSAPAVIRMQHPTPLDDDLPTITKCPQDAYGDGRGLCSVRLHPGSYQIFLHLHGRKNTTSFACNYFLNARNQVPDLLLPINDTVVPNIVVKETKTGNVAKLAGAHLSVTLMNTHDTFWATAGVAELRDAPPGLLLAPHGQTDAHYPLPRLAPRQTRQLRLDLQTDPHFLQSQTDGIALTDAVTATIAVSYEIGRGRVYESLFSISLDVVVWGRARSYHFTYVDVDGSIQAAAVLPPANPCVGAPAGDDACPVLLSTHGAGVDAIGPAWTESYKTQNQSWVLLPTGRRKYGLNWEGPQMKSAITALRVFAASLPGVPADEAKLWKARDDHWLQAGHSMGGHGALLLSTHYPDMLVAALPAMGWLRLSTYGGDAFYEQLSYSDAAQRALLTIASAEFSADLYAENLLGIPVLARVGSDDDNVPPSNLRRFCRLLKENEFFNNFTTSNVQLNEVPGEGHWFDGVVDDNVLQPFLHKHLSSARKPPLPKQFTVFTMNPASSGTRGGFRILSLEVVFQKSRLRVIQDFPEDGTWRIYTENVRRFRYQPIHGLLERPAQILVDNSNAPILISASSLEKGKKYLDFCAYPAPMETDFSSPGTRLVGWKKCRDTKSWGKDKSRERGPDNSGPAFQVLGERKLVVVYPEGDVELQNTAVAYSNSLYLRGISVQVSPDSNVSVELMSSLGDTNHVLLGGPNMNRMAVKLHSEGYSADVSFEGHAFCIAGSKCYQEAGTGIAFLAGGPKRTLLFFVAGTDREGMLAALSFLPYSPSSNVPEWVIVSKKRGWGFRGLDGVVGLGYWDREWKLEPRKSYPAEFIFDMKRSGTTCVISAAQSSTLFWGIIAIIFCVVVTTVLLLVKRRRRGRSIQYELVAAEESISGSKMERNPAPIERDVLLDTCSESEN